LLLITDTQTTLLIKSLEERTRCRGGRPSEGDKDYQVPQFTSETTEPRKNSMERIVCEAMPIRDNKLVGFIQLDL